LRDMVAALQLTFWVCQWRLDIFADMTVSFREEIVTNLRSATEIRPLSYLRMQRNTIKRSEDSL
jgi:hypothetical protein